MAKFAIRNITLSGITLPLPYNALLGPGDGFVVEDTESAIVATLGGPTAMLGVLSLTQVSDSNALSRFPNEITSRFVSPSANRFIYARPTGSDETGNGNSVATAYKTMQRAVRDVPNIIPPGVRYTLSVDDLTETTPTDYAVPAWKSPVTPIEFDPFSPYFLYVGGVSIEATPRLVASIPVADATIAPTDRLALTTVTGSDFLLITLDPVGPNPVRASWAPITAVGTTFAVAAGVVTLTSAAALFTAFMVGRTIVITGATSTANNGRFLITSFISATQITYANAAGVAQAFPGTWAVNMLAGKQLVAANALENALVIDSTSTTLLVAQTVVPGLTGTFRLMEPSATFTVSSSATTFIVQGGLAARNVDSIAISGIKVIDSTPTLSAFGLEVSGNGAAAVQLCEIQELLSIIGSVDSCRLNRLHLTSRARIAGSWSLQSVLFDACTALPFSALGPAVGNFRRVAFVGGTTVRMCNSQFSGQNAIVGGPSALFLAENVLIADVTLPAGAADGLRFHGLRGLLRNADIRNCGRDGVRCDEGVGYLELLNVRSTTPNGAITATGVGVRTLNGAWTVRVDAATSGASAGTQLRGAGGEMTIGTIPVRTFADFLATAPIKNQFDTNRPITGTGDSFAVAGGVVTLTDAAAAFIASVAGQMIMITGSTSPANDGVFVIATRIDASNITYANPDAVAEAFAGTWSIVTVTHTQGDEIATLAGTGGRSGNRLYQI